MVGAAEASWGPAGDGAISRSSRSCRSRRSIRMGVGRDASRVDAHLIPTADDDDDVWSECKAHECCPGKASTAINLAPMLRCLYSCPGGCRGMN